MSKISRTAGWSAATPSEPRWALACLEASMSTRRPDAADVLDPAEIEDHAILALGATCHVRGEGGLEVLRGRMVDPAHGGQHHRVDVALRRQLHVRSMECHLSRIQCYHPPRRNLASCLPACAGGLTRPAAAAQYRPGRRGLGCHRGYMNEALSDRHGSGPGPGHRDALLHDAPGRHGRPRHQGRVPRPRPRAHVPGHQAQARRRRGASAAPRSTAIGTSSVSPSSSKPRAASSFSRSWFAARTW
jgi:hypothetical protein